MCNYDYRVRLLLDLARALGLPSAVLSLLFLVYGKRPGLLLTVLLHAAAVVLWLISRNAFKRYTQSQECKQLGARPIPCVVGRWPGNVDILAKIIRSFKKTYILDVYRDLFEEYQCTTLNMRILWVDNIITMDAEHSKFVTSSGVHHFWRGHFQKERMETLLGRGIFNRDDQEWKIHRTMARPFFARERVSDFEIFERYTASTLNVLAAYSASNQPCEAQDLYSRFTLDAASEFLFGRNLDTLSAVLPTPKDAAESLNTGNSALRSSMTPDIWGSFVHAFESAQHIVMTRGRIGYFWPLFELFGDKTMPHIRIIREWLDPIVREVSEESIRTRKANKRPTGDASFLQHLADSTQDTAFIRDQLLNMLLASRDTTACLLTYMTYFMAVYPEIAQKMRAEVLEHCGTNGTPTYDIIRNLKYMRAVINETLRLYPPVPVNVRESRPAAACAFPPPDPSFDAPPSQQQALYMPGGTTIMYFPLLTQRNPALWGPSADEFDPDRWLQPDRDLSRTLNDSMAFAPFSAGPRVCLGQNYAYAEASYFLVRLLQRFDTFTLATDVQPRESLPPTEWKSRKGRQCIEQLWPASSLTLYVKGGLWVRFGKS